MNRIALIVRLTRDVTGRCVYKSQRFRLWQGHGSWSSHVRCHVLLYYYYILYYHMDANHIHIDHICSICVARMNHNIINIHIYIYIASMKATRDDTIIGDCDRFGRHINKWSPRSAWMMVVVSSRIFVLLAVSRRQCAWHRRLTASGYVALAKRGLARSVPSLDVRRGTGGLAGPTWGAPTLRASDGARKPAESGAVCMLTRNIKYRLMMK